MGHFGMIAVEAKTRGIGVGTTLIRTCEGWTRSAGCKMMKCDILKPKKWIHPKKVLLHNWYTKLGYISDKKSLRPVDDRWAKDHSCECVSLDYLKSLSE